MRYILYTLIGLFSLSAETVDKVPEIDKQEIINYLKLTNQTNALNAQFESSLTAQQKKILEVFQDASKNVKAQLDKLNELCGKGFTFSEQSVTCVAVNPVTVK